MKRLTAITLLLLGAIPLLGVGLTGCNTVKGAGQDVKSAGKAIENKAEEKKSY